MSVDPHYERARGWQRELQRAIPTALAAALAIAYLIVKPPGADLPAQLYRAHLFAQHGFALWDNGWYSGHNLLGYSVLYPPLAALTAPRLIAAIAAVVTAAAFTALADRQFGPDAWLGSSWLAAGTATELVSGRLTFALGLAGVALTALALQRHLEEPRGRMLAAAAAAAFLTALASPVAALFAALAGAAPLAARPRDGTDAASGITVIVAALLPVVVLAIAFPEGGTQPFAFSTLWPLLVIGAAILAAIAAGAAQRRRHPFHPRAPAAPVLTAAIVLYLLGCLAAFVLHTPVGANATRLGELVAGPLVALLLYPRLRALPRARATRRTLLTVLLVAAVPLTYVQVKDAVTDVVHGSSGGAGTAAYYRPLLAFLDSRHGAAEHTFRVEIPFTEGHWETYYVASQIPLARGWERQLDIHDNGLFYDAKRPLTAAAYRRWLHRNAVAYVAVASAPPDYSSRQEVALIDHGLPYLRLLRTLPHWRVYAVRHATPIATGAARLTALTQDSMTFEVTHTGGSLVRVHFSPYWELSGVPGCVSRAGAFTHLRLDGTGPALLRIAFTTHRIGASTARCD